MVTMKSKKAFHKAIIRMEGTSRDLKKKQNIRGIANSRGGGKIIENKGSTRKDFCQEGESRNASEKKSKDWQLSKQPPP